MSMLGRRTLAGAAACLWVASVASGVTSSVAWGQEVKELRIGYQPNPIQDASIAMMETWGARHGVKIVKIPNSYGVYVEKMTASLTSGSDQYDVIWHNDDWGQLWAHLLEPTDDVDGLKYADKWGMSPIIFNNAEGQNTVVPMGHTFGVFYYRTDLVNENEVPQTWDDIVKIGKKLQAEGKVKFGYVGAMSMNNTWFTWFWSMWTNNCDVLMPVYERDNKVLASNGWKSALTEPCMRQSAEFWWDASTPTRSAHAACRHTTATRPTRCSWPATPPLLSVIPCTGRHSTTRRNPRWPARSTSPSFRSVPTAKSISPGMTFGVGQSRNRSRPSARRSQSRCSPT